ncbi:hypothetical protein K4G97_21055, partial [Mycobacterium tuberculosis]|nr:hypothetical protein [Mycobacterium tuberculosis]
PRKIYETRELQIALGLVAMGEGVSVVPHSVYGLKRDDISYKPLDDPNLVSPIIMSMRMLDESEDIRAMQALHYVPNRSAQLLAGKAAPSIGLITASLTLHAPSQIAAAIKRHASLHQLEVAIAMPAQADFVALQARLDELRAQH